MIVRFKNVGRDKYSFEREISSVSFEQLERALLSHKPRPLMSRDIDFAAVNEEETRGVVLAGCRTVGEWEIA